MDIVPVPFDIKKFNMAPTLKSLKSSVLLIFLRNPHLHKIWLISGFHTGIK